MAEEKMAKQIPEPVDAYVGSRVKSRRLELGISQEKLGEGVGLTFQQIQKYEKGTNRISASRLQEISNILKMPITSFFENAPSKTSRQKFTEHVTIDDVSAFLATPDGQALARAMMRIKDVPLRKSICALVMQLAA